MAKTVVKVRIQSNDSWLHRLIHGAATVKIQLQGEKVLYELKAITPKDTGRAAESWTKTNTKNGYTLSSHIDYMKALNEGHSSKAPKNFIEHTVLRYGKPDSFVVMY